MVAPTPTRAFGPLPYWLSFTMPLVTGLGIAFGGPVIAATPVLLFVLVPIIDQVVGLDTRNPDVDLRRTIVGDLALYLWVPVQLVMIGWFLVRVGEGVYGPGELVALTVAVGLTAGAGGINVAHELMHRASKVARATSEVLMTSVTYPHFCVEHVHGHHRHVATPRDPATARRGESLLAFWPRSLVGSFLSAWRIERDRKRGFSGDRRIRFTAMVAAAQCLAYSLGGWLAVGAFAGQSLVAILLLETINYIEHYGLLRRELEPGKYERVQPRHSWNASHRVTNWYLFNLQRHSDHHYLASRPYYDLRHHRDAPQLPFSYPTAFLTALVPPLWRRVMDPRVDEWETRAAREAAE